jgi:signal transduction histidine kinase
MDCNDRNDRNNGNLSVYLGKKHAPLNAEDLLTITNLIVIVLASGIAALAVWVQHKRLLDKLRKQSRELKYELDSNMRLHTLVFHDIINPLSVISTTAELTKTKGSGNQNELVIIHNMTRRIINTIDAARRMELGGIPETENISMIDLFNELKTAFGMKMDQKKLNLVFEGDKNINIITTRSLLCDSVLGNFLSNAVKFSERASTIKITASREQNNMVRISIIDSGNGFPIKLLQCVEQGKTYKSADGTEGEKDTHME